MDNYDYLDLGTIWKSKRKHNLALVIGLANFDLPEKYHKTNPPQVVFTDGTYIFSSTVERFLSLRTFVRLDKGIKASLLEAFSSPITEEDEEPSLYLTDEDDDDLLLSADDEDDADYTVEATHAEVAKAAIAEEAPAAKKIAASVDKQLKLTIEEHETDDKLREIEQSLYKYDQFRDINGCYYHKLTFTDRDAVEYLLKSIDNINSMTIDISDISIPVNFDLVTTAYASAANTIENGVAKTQFEYNIIFAALEEDSDNEDKTTDATTSTQAVENASAEQLESNKESNDSDEDASNVQIVADSTEPRSDVETAISEPNGIVQQADEAVLQQPEQESNSSEEDNLEEVSINYQDVDSSEEDDEDSNVEEIQESEEEPELENAEEISDAELLQQSLIMPDTEIDDIINQQSDPVAESLASKLETVISQDKSEEPEESKQVEQTEEKTESAEDAITAQEDKPEEVEENKE